MKRLFFTLSLLTAVGAGVNAQTPTVLVNDDFESHPLGSFYGAPWVNWSLDPTNASQNLIISSEVAFSGTKSGKIGPKADNQDVLLQLNNTYSTGVVTSEWKMYIPDSNYAYYNIQENTTPAISWGYECYTNFFEGELPNGDSLNGKMVWLMSDGAGSTAVYAYVAVPYNEWFSMKQVMNLDDKTISLSVNNVEATYYQTNVGNEWPGSLGSIGGFNFYGADNSDSGKANTYFLDDMSVVFVGDVTSLNNVNKQQLKVNFYPNPVNGTLNITAEETMQQVEIYNVAGQKVMQTTPNSKTTAINVSSLAAGLYSATIKADNKTLTKKFTVK